MQSGHPVQLGDPHHVEIKATDETLSENIRRALGWLSALLCELQYSTQVRGEWKASPFLGLRGLPGGLICLCIPVSTSMSLARPSS